MKLKQMTKSTWQYWDELLTIIKDSDGLFSFRITGLIAGDVIVSDYKWVSLADVKEYCKRVDVHRMHNLTTGRTRIYDYSPGELHEIKPAKLNASRCW